MLKKIKLLVKSKAPLVHIQNKPGVSLFLSMSDGKQRAQVFHCFGSDFDTAWTLLEQHYQQWLKEHSYPAIQWVRVDWTQEVKATHFGQLETWLKQVKRNYFRWGLIFGDQGQYAFTEQELNANATLYGGVKISHVIINKNNLASYGRRKYGSFDADITADQPVWMLDNVGVFVSNETEPVELYGKGRDAGRRVIEKLSTQQVEELIVSSSEYLSTQVQESGRFYYGWHPCFDREIKFYNALRHCSTIYSMVEAWEVTQSEELLAAIDNALNYALTHFVKIVTDESGVKRAFVVDTGNEIKLGANAVLILALSKYSELIDKTRYLELLELLALGIELMQNPNTGQFTHVLNYPDLSVKEPFRIIYYDGEAAFGLMRLYGLTKDPRWLAIVEKAFDYFIANEHWQAHDHWLSYCVNELTLYREEEKYYRFGLQNVAGYLDFIANRITTFPTLLELMMAAQRMVERLQQSERYSYLLDELDIEQFYEALEKRAHYLLNGYFWPEIAMYFANPQRIVGSFFIRHHSFRVRIDDVEHYLSGYVAYLKYLQQKGVLSKRGIADITAGEWLIEPNSDGWQATGLCIFKPIFKAGHLLVARGERANGYLSDIVIKQLAAQQASAIMCVNPVPYLKLGLPIIQVKDVREAILSLGKAARDNFSEKVIGITGSAGKTTAVAMMAHALSQFGVTGHTQESANLPVGIAWNLTNMPAQASNWVVEMAIGSMADNAAMVKPQVALVTNIAPAHLKHHKDTETIAKRKSLIMNEMNSNGALVLFGETLHKDIFLDKAQEKNIKIITYGEGTNNDIQLLEVNNNLVKVKFFKEIYDFNIGLSSKHLILNALGVFAVLHAYGLNWKNILNIFNDFNPVKGRGEIFLLKYNNKKITIYDESYNANPLSMQVAIDSIKNKENRFLILGDMMELEPEEVYYHKALKEDILKSNPNKLILCGPLMKNLWVEIENCDHFSSVKKAWFNSVDEVVESIDSWIDAQDSIMLKASNSMEFEKIIDVFKYN